MYERTINPTITNSEPFVLTENRLCNSFNEHFFLMKIELVTHLMNLATMNTKSDSRTCALIKEMKMKIRHIEQKLRDMIYETMWKTNYRRSRPLDYVRTDSVFTV